MDSKLLDPQYLDMNFEQYYLITWPECQQFDEFIEAEDMVFPIVIPGTTTPASFVNKELIAELIERDGL